MMSEVDPNVVAMMARATGLGLKLLGAKVIAMLSLLFSFSLFCWAMWAHEWIAYTAASTFTLIVFLPALWVSRSKE